AAIASFSSLETAANCVVVAASGGLPMVGMSGVGAAAGACVACARLLTAGRAAQPGEQTATSASKTVPTAMAFPDGLPEAKPLSELSTFTSYPHRRDHGIPQVR